MRLNLQTRRCAVVSLLLWLGCSKPVRGADPYADALDKRFTPGTTQTENDSRTAAFEDGLRQQVREMSQRSEPDAPVAAVRAGTWPQWTAVMAAAFGVGVVASIGLRRWNKWLDQRIAERESTASAMAEDPLMGEFLRLLSEDSQRVLPATGSAPPYAPDVILASGLPRPSLAARDPLLPGSVSTSRTFAVLRASFPTLSWSQDDAERRRLLRELLDHVELVKEGNGLVHSHAVRLLACALQGLLKHFTIKATNITPSALRTAASALDLLELLSTLTLRSDLVTEPPVRLLVVDDDDISRRALSLALKKAFNEPDLAPDGQTALALGAQNAYDVVFLDVEMPDLDGFEVCSKIHDTPLNRTSPVVFVTSHNDFDSRAKSALLGAHDLIAKPFLVFEITVKALTLVLRSRMGEHNSKQALSGTDEPGSGSPANVVDMSSAGAVALRSVPPDSADSGEAAELKELQVTLQDASRSDGTAQQKLLIDLSRRLRFLCYSSRHRELRLAWQIGVCLEGLVKKLACSTPTVTASALRTAAGALDVLHEFARGGNLLVDTGDPARLLVVDDDAVSRFAVCAALKDAFGPPDLAPDGETGLSLATKQTYEAIFLDVEMPGMDGFELCTRIHNTSLNTTTPIVFVTQHTDFESRAKAADTGGHDLIAKPFLPMEVKLKALTLVFRSRLERRQKDIQSHETASETSAPPQLIGANNATAPAGLERPSEAHVRGDVSRRIAAETDATSAPTRRDLVERPETLVPFHQSPRGIASNGVPAKNSDVPETVRITQPTVQEYANAHYTSAPTHLGQLKDRLQAAGLTEDSALRQDLLGEAYVGIHSLTSDAERAQARVFGRVGSGLQALLRKLLERADACTPSRLEAATEALALLEDLCRSRVEPLLDEAPVRILVVDDDPIALRALACAIQMVFNKPGMAHCGEEALKLASESPFDLILLDVLMPGMDGFATCAKIRETAHNERTPVVFVTSQCDTESRRQADLAGGCGFIPKPFLAAEIALRVLTFALRGRLERLRSGAVKACPEDEGQRPVALALAH